MLGADMRSIFDGIELDEVVVATYYMAVQRDQDLLERVRKIAGILYPGSWTPVTGVTPETRRRHSPRILGVYEAPPYETGVPEDAARRQVMAQVAIPLANLGDNLATLMCNVSGELMAYDNVKLVDLYLPPQYAALYKGPTFGVQGIREMLDVLDRPLVVAIFKPSQGYTAQTGAEIFYEAAAGGVDIVKDDELLANPDYCRRSERVRRYMEMERRAFEETGERTLYAVNISDGPERLLDNALEAIDLGANALMINYLQVGMDAARMVCEDSRITVPVLGHNTGSFSLYSNPYSGLSITLSNAKLPRLIGVDMGILLIEGGSYPALRDRCVLLAREMLAPFHDVGNMLPILAAGVTPGVTEQLLATYGRDVALGSGSCIFGHPQGPKAGAEAFRRAISAVTEGRAVEDAASENEALRVALETWGPHDSSGGKS